MKGSRGFLFIIPAALQLLVAAELRKLQIAMTQLATAAHKVQSASW